jgi:hypothetical protein
MRLRVTGPITDTGSVADVEDELVAHARAAKRHLAAYEREMAQVEALLPVVRVKTKKGPKELEAMIEGLRDRGFISRRTAEAAGTSKKTPAASAS